MKGERDQALSQARARLQETQDLRKEFSSVIEKKGRVEGEVERLQSHLVSVKESHKGELVAAEEREAGLRRKVAGLEEEVGGTRAELREKNISLRHLNLALEGFTRHREHELELEKQAEAMAAMEQARNSQVS